MQLNLNNETFVACDEVDRGDSCAGCAFEDSAECVMSEGLDIRCAAHTIIWVRLEATAAEKPPTIKPTEESKYTVEQVLDSYGNITNTNVTAAVCDRVKDRLKQVEESDYKTYIMLKARYEG